MVFGLLFGLVAAIVLGGLGGAVLEQFLRVADTHSRGGDRTLAALSALRVSCTVCTFSDEYARSRFTARDRASRDERNSRACCSWPAA